MIDRYVGMSEDEMAAKDEEATEDRPGQSVTTVPDEPLPAIRQL